ncbi:hypothetical protein Y1Q_0016566 [Alligator mississippiensis]|uniref:Uncharacterized protein n=1 Tax=Alligator mississippiensis TaxID=8496 RepID=A0A151N369_ALLMI|nr:hypothetical protein Y1Q_0016566 [Alligator mississippiensis]
MGEEVVPCSRLLLLMITQGERCTIKNKEQKKAKGQEATLFGEHFQHQFMALEINECRRLWHDLWIKCICIM